MTPFDRFLEFIVAGWRIDLSLLGKLAVLLLLFLYFVFALVVVKQVNLMNKAIYGLMNRPLLIMAWALVILAAAVIVLSLVIL